jgi:hypothetical protein
MATQKWTDVLLGKLQTLLGERGPTEGHAVRKKDLAAMFDTFAGRAKAITDAAIGTVSASTDATIDQITTTITAAQADADAAAAAAAAVTANHNALVSGFVGGDLATAFDQARDMANAAMQGWLADPIFADWTNSTTLNPNNWHGTAGEPLYQTQLTNGYGGGVYSDLPVGSNTSSCVANVDVNDGLIGANVNATDVTVSLEFDFISGDPAGVRLYVQWSPDNSTWTTGTKNGQSSNILSFAHRGITVQPGVRQLIQEVWQRPAGSFSYMRIVWQPKVTVTTAQQVKTYLLNMRASTQAEIDLYKLYTVASGTNGVLTTVQGIGVAIAQISTSLEAQVGSTNSTLINDYLTTANTTSAIALAKLELNSSIGAAGVCINQFMADTWASAGQAPVITDKVSPEIGRDFNWNLDSLTQAYTMYASNSVGWTGPKNLDAYKIEVDFTLTSGTLQSVQVRLDWDISTGSFVTNKNLTDMLNTPVQTGYRQTGSAIFKRPTNYSGTFTQHQLYLLLNNSPPYAAKNITIHSVRVTPASSTDLTALTLDSSVTSILATSVDALTGTAMGVLLTQLDVQAGGTSATVTNQGLALVDLQGNASASYTLGVKAGTGGATLELVAADNVAGGAVSGIKLEAQFIDLVGAVRASSLLISAQGNAFPDYDFLDSLLYSGDAFSIVATSNTKVGSNYLQIASNAAQKIVYSLPFPVLAAQTYKVSGGAWLATNTAGSGSALLQFQTMEPNGSGGWAVVRTLNISNQTDKDLGDVTLTPTTVVMAANETRCRWRIIRQAGGTANGRFGGFICQQMTGADLIVNGAITGQHLTTASAVITDSAQIANLTVDTLNIAGNAVTIPMRGTGAVEVTVTSTYRSVMQLNSRRAGVPTDIFTSFIVNGYNINGNVLDLMVLKVRIRRAGTTIYELQLQVASEKDYPVVLNFTDMDLGTGNTQYSVEVQAGSSGLHVKAGGTISLTQLKK